MPLGAVPASSGGSAKIISIGNKYEAITATSAATNVEIRYKMIIVFIVPALFALAKTEMTKKNTKTGARPFNALVKSVPKSAMNCENPIKNVLPAPPAAKSDDSIRLSGNTKPNIAPITRPITIRKIKLNFV